MRSQYDHFESAIFYSQYICCNTDYGLKRHFCMCATLRSQTKYSELSVLFSFSFSLTLCLPCFSGCWGEKKRKEKRRRKWKRLAGTHRGTQPFSVWVTKFLDMLFLLQTLLQMVSKNLWLASVFEVIINENLHSWLWVKPILNRYNQSCAFSLSMLQVSAQSWPL